MASVAAIRNGLKARLETIDGLRVYEYHAPKAEPPTAIIMPGDPGRSNTYAVKFDATMGRGSDDLVFTVLVVVSNVVERAAQDKLDAYLDGEGAPSIKAAIEGEATLGGIVSFARVAAIRQYGLVQYANQTFVGAEFLVEVTT